MSSPIILQTIDKEEIGNIIFSLNSIKASGLNSIPSTILFLLKKQNFKPIGGFIQPHFYDCCFPFCT